MAFALVVNALWESLVNVLGDDPALAEEIAAAALVATCQGSDAS